ncbi:hypothetical protein [uncultured Prevotella sp.]|uniref:hypothetical protein n=1 Tax=uncultured Prevotella sp. TaxID=159272 RepID=UPI0026662CDB|nr:hypothetical protein [uncultured Prevotella sp.]
MKTLRLFMLTAAIMCSLVANAQDVIVKNDGSTITSKVMEITGTEIKYKKYSNLKGPTYSINKTDVNYINYENGERENFGKTSNVTPNREETYNTQNNFALQQTNNGQMSDAELLKSIDKVSLNKKAKRYKKIGWIGGATFVAAGVVLNLLSEYPWSLDEVVGIIGYASIGAGAVWTTSFLMASNHLKKKALYSANTSTQLMQFNLSQSKKSAIYANINMLNDNMTNRKALGFGMNFNF